MLEFLTANEALSEELCAKMLGWRYCGGFSAHNQVRVAREDREGRIRSGSGLSPHASLRSSPLWQCAKRHAGELRESGRMGRAIEGQVIERFITCGDPREGFARIYCDACRHEYLLAYSCKTRTFCPSCHQKRVLL